MEAVTMMDLRTDRGRTAALEEFRSALGLRNATCYINRDDSIGFPFIVDGYYCRLGPNGFEQLIGTHGFKVVTRPIDGQSRPYDPSLGNPPRQRAWINRDAIEKELRRLLPWLQRLTMGPVIALHSGDDVFWKNHCWTVVDGVLLARRPGDPLGNSTAVTDRKTLQQLIKGV